MHQRAGRRTNRAGGFHRPGTDEHAKITISLEDAYRGRS